MFIKGHAYECLLRRKVVKMEEERISELTSCHGHIKITAIYRETLKEKDWMTSQKDLLQIKV